ncbi:MAG: OmpP1/FadL family transporter, partial [Thiohalomonadales bacterium]
QNVSDNGVDNASGYGLKFGIQSEIVKGLSIAASYQSEMDMGEFDKYSGLFAEKGNFDIPSTWTLGLAWKLVPRSHIVFDVQQINYSDIAAISNPIAPLLTCTGSQPGCLGGSQGAGFGWTDITIYKLGYEFGAGANWLWRLGYSHTNQPIPDSEVVFNILAPAVIEDHATLGFTVLVSKKSEINFQYMHGFKNSITGKNTFNPSQDIILEMVQNEIEVSWAKKF